MSDRTFAEILLDNHVFAPLPEIKLPPTYRHVRTKEVTCETGDRLQDEYIGALFTADCDKMRGRWLRHLAVCKFCRQREYRNATSR